MVESAIIEWSAEGVTLKSLLTGPQSHLPDASLVLAITNLAEMRLRGELAECGIAVQSIGDANATRKPLLRSMTEERRHWR
ncbi:hypothetical protein [Pontibaca salina]|uniref:hypothetical protein n=1 Tax=Pontibaca salina TaxID=2795731 RepID=UPI0018E6473B|nr:hypothetical protein [Pontibaca salina]